MILEKIAERTRQRVEDRKRKIPPEVMRKMAVEKERGDFSFERALRSPGLSFICEVKKASPSKGVIAEDYPYLQIAADYEAAGADAISVLTEPYFFLGDDRHLEEIASSVSIPVLRKDFTVDEYMIYEAKVLGADAVLLICSLLGPDQLREYLHIAGELGLSTIAEAHDGAEIERALAAGASIIGVNNRNLRDFTVDLGNGARLRKEVPEGVVFVSESGIRSSQDIAALRENGADAVLIGEALMRSDDRRAALRRFREAGM